MEAAEFALKLVRGGHALTDIAARDGAPDVEMKTVDGLIDVGDRCGKQMNARVVATNDETGDSSI